MREGLQEPKRPEVRITSANILACTDFHRYHKTHGHQTQQLHENGDGTFSIVNPETSTPYPGTLGMEKEKPYKCEVCGKRYKNLNGLKYVSNALVERIPSLRLIIISAQATFATLQSGAQAQQSYGSGWIRGFGSQCRRTSWYRRRRHDVKPHGTLTNPITNNLPAPQLLRSHIRPATHTRRFKPPPPHPSTGAPGFIYYITSIPHDTKLHWAEFFLNKDISRVMNERVRTIPRID